MLKQWVFDAPHYQAITQARLQFIDTFLPDLVGNNGLLSALDAGCGIGEFSAYLAKLGLRTSGIDGRVENIDEARRRYPDIAFNTYDIEVQAVQKIGKFDLVLCVGLLYHLENPIAALRNLQVLTEKALLIETQVYPVNALGFGIVQEPPYEDQGLNSLALVPSEAGLIKILYQIGFPYVYTFRALPDHGDFVETWLDKQKRVFVMAAHQPLAVPICTHVVEPSPVNHWLKPVSYSIIRWQQRVARLRRGNLHELIAMLKKRALPD